MCFLGQFSNLEGESQHPINTEKDDLELSWEEGGSFSFTSPSILPGGVLSIVLVKARLRFLL